MYGHVYIYTLKDLASFHAVIFSLSLHCIIAFAHCTFAVVHCYIAYYISNLVYRYILKIWLLIYMVLIVSSVSQVMVPKSSPWALELFSAPSAC